MKKVCLDKEKTNDVYRVTLDDVPDEGTFKVLATALNHRDLFQRQGLYPGLAFGTTMGSDAVGMLDGRRMLMMPCRGWDQDPRHPERVAEFGILGGTKQVRLGTLQEWMPAEHDELEQCPSHLSDYEAAALPLAGLTAFRATFTKARVRRGHRVLITGIGGGVALFAMQFCLAAGASVYVTSSSAAKLRRAVGMGAVAGFDYTDPAWHTRLAEHLNKELLDAVIDEAGGDVMERVVRLMHGGRVVVYGMTTGPQITFPMTAVLRHIDLLASTMGSREEFSEMVAFVARHQIRPVVSAVVHGLERTERAFEHLRDPQHFGKVVIALTPQSRM